MFPLLLIATIKAYGSFVPFTLSLDNYNHVNFIEDLFELRFNLHIGTVYVEQEMDFVDGDISETILMHAYISVDGHV